MPRWISNIVTTCQLSQMLMGFYVNMYSAYLLSKFWMSIFHVMTFKVVISLSICHYLTNMTSLTWHFDKYENFSLHFQIFLKSLNFFDSLHTRVKLTIYIAILQKEYVFTLIYPITDTGVACRRFENSILYSYVVYGSFMFLFGKLFIDVVSKSRNNGKKID